ncbi:MAG: hypothetical protein AAB505_02990 [Patescibacteria group bacterium]
MLNGGEERIERFKRKLYALGDKPVPLRRSALSSSRADTAVPDWSSDQSSPQAESISPPRRSFFLRLIFLIALAFFLGSVGTATYIFYHGSNVVSSANVDLTVAGEKTVAAGETLSLQILVSNHNTAALQAVDLVVEYPAGTRAATDLAKVLTRERWALGTIKPGAVISQDIRAVVFGEKEAEQEIKVTAEYRLADSNAIFDKVFLYRYLITDSPVSLAIDSPAEVNAGQPLTLTLEVLANSTSPVKDLALRADYPPGFTFKNATPAPAANHNFWRLGELLAGGQKKIVLVGALDGQQDDSKSFRFSVGSVKTGATEEELDLVYDELFQPVTIKRPQVGLAVTVNGQAASGDRTTSSGDLLRLDLSWVNNLPTEIIDGRIEVLIDGAVLDERSVNVADGFYQSSEDKIVWHRGTKSALARLAPGATGQASFTFSTKPLIGNDNQRSIIENPNINFSFRFTGRQIATGLPDEPVDSSINQRIKVNSVFQLAAEVLRRNGPFVNTGPLPPRVGLETSYAIVWSVVNSSNAVHEATVKATLPTYVRWLGLISPTTEKVSFNEATGEVTWDLETVEAGRGVSSAARELAFQVALKPSVSQISQAPVLVTASTLTGIDGYTGQVLNYERRALDTKLLNDPEFNFGDDRVAP